ncbi:glycosyltransferase [Candidatus Borkfalkia ceftriaxoniphila]|jgi:singapore isolate B (sub-type 7) whole genome shotgun sequence assembly, scaffold_6|uniref:Glycosyltransferase n=1 Tax=Candidatus Borkfalkia ceftriaxoniphila TaxID=2508949 RepID=A0A4Q2K517_9FIRM|nr:glycosyltransferase [Candidatus Borkfalkia ceftriaxoniphila]RXZ58052.1 glycosyltransferase [Candidatus Borkfalkia ceftriaxoniphila]
MKITIVADVLGEENNGTTITAKRLIQHLKERGHAVRVISPSEEDGEGFIRVPKINFGIFNSYVAKNGVELAKPNEDMIRETIKDSDVVHILMPFFLGNVAIKMCRENGIPVTTAFHVQPENVSCHFGLQKSAFVNRRIYKFFHKHFYAYTEYIHCPTRFIAEELKKHGYKQDLRVISNGVDELYRAERGEKPERYRGKFCILSTGRLTKEKCQKLLIEAVKKSRHADEIQLFIAGQGPLLKKLVKAGEDLKNPPVIGFHPKEELVKMINYCDLYCHPSYAEIESIACVEAITCGLVPVISDSKKSAARYFALRPECLFSAGNSANLAQKIDYMIEHPEFRETLRTEYAEYAKQFALEKCIDEMEKMFTDAVEGKHR